MLFILQNGEGSTVTSIERGGHLRSTFTSSSQRLLRTVSIILYQFNYSTKF